MNGVKGAPPFFRHPTRILTRVSSPVAQPAPAPRELRRSSSVVSFKKVDEAKKKPPRPKPTPPKVVTIPQRKPQPPKDKFFFERQQRSDSCRLHAINNLVGYKILDINAFPNVCKEFGDKFNCAEASRKNWTVINSYRENVCLFFIRKQFTYPSFLTSPRNRQGDLAQIGLRFDDIQSPLALVWNSGHIWACRRIRGVWHSFDSLNAGPRVQALQKNCFISFVYAKKEQCSRLRSALETYVKKANPSTTQANLVMPLLSMRLCFDDLDPETRHRIENFCENVSAKGETFFRQNFNINANICFDP